MAGILEEVAGMQKQGMSEQDIIKTLRDRNVPYKDILDAISNTKIRQAVEAEETPSPSDYNQSAMEESIMAKQKDYPEQIYYSQTAGQGQGTPEKVAQEIPEQPIASEPPIMEQYAAPEYGQQYEYQPQGNYYNPSSLSSDIISEISEQVVSEKLSEIRKGIDKIVDFKTNIETKTELIEERLKRIEKVIDAIQLSVLKKVGDYVTNMEDIKKELIETQKTFTKVSEKKHHSEKHHKK